MLEQEEWFRKRYIEDVAPKSDIAKELGCSVHNVSRLARKYGLKRGRAIQKGVKPWNYGLTKETDERVASISEKQSGSGNPMFGKSSWNSGLKKDTDERLMLISNNLTGRKHSEETIKKLRNAKLGVKGVDAANYKRGWWLNASGYVEIKNELGKKVYLHRHVAENAIGRKLSRSEHVHHLDENKQNNKPENLIILSIKDHTILHKHCLPASPEMQKAWLLEMGIAFETLEKA